MQTIRLLSLILVLGLMVHQLLHRPSSEALHSSAGLIEENSLDSSTRKEALPDRRSPRQTSGTSPVQEEQSSNQKASANGGANEPFEAKRKMTRSKAHNERAVSVVEHLRLISQACLEYRQMSGEFPPTLAALKRVKGIELNLSHRPLHGYRFTYTRRRSLASFAVNADPVAGHVRGKPRFIIDESQVIKAQPSRRKAIRL